MEIKGAIHTAYQSSVGFVLVMKQCINSPQNAKLSNFTTLERPQTLAVITESSTLLPTRANISHAEIIPSVRRADNGSPGFGKDSRRVKLSCKEQRTCSKQCEELGSRTRASACGEVCGLEQQIAGPGVP